jgi:two-component system CheB/CheR fusion protein
MSSEHTDTDLESFLEHLRESRGFDFAAYKRATLERRIKRRMSAVHAADYGEYLDYIQVHPDEFEPLFNSILINVTSFFRDRDTWDFIAAEIVPRLVALQNVDGTARPIRVWSAGCSSGEEAYTIAMLLAEALGGEAFRERVKIYATDIDEEALSDARHATYTKRQVGPIPQELLDRYFDLVGEDYSFKKDFRRAPDATT